MMLNKSVKIAFAIFVLFQLWLAGRVVYAEMQVSLKGKEVKFLCTFYDPEDPFMGRYLNLNPGQPCVPVKDKKPAKRDKYFVVLGDSNGFAEPRYVTTTRPESNLDYLEFPGKTEFELSFFGNKRDCKTINYPFTRFYLAEEDAPRAEKMVNEALRDSASQVWISVKILEGHYQVNDVFINGKNLKATLND